MFHCRMGLGTSLLEKEDSVSLLVGPHRGEGEGIGQMRRVLLVEDHAALVLDQTLLLVERGDDGETE